jgi:probable addiction module antidote protein
MSEKSFRPPIPRQPCDRQAAADYINQALEKSDAAEICLALADATRLYNISDLAQKSGLARQSIYRAFAADPRKPKFTTVLTAGHQPRRIDATQHAKAPNEVMRQETAAFIMLVLFPRDAKQFGDLPLLHARRFPRVLHAPGEQLSKLSFGLGFCHADMMSRQNETRQSFL